MTGAGPAGDRARDIGQLPPLFTPFALKGATFRNRIVVSPMCQYAAVEGYAGRWHETHHGRFALSGVGGAVVESTGVSAEGRITPGCLGIYDDRHIEGLRRIVATYRDQNIPVGIQLNHAGRKASADVPLSGAAPFAADDPRAWRTVAPSAVPLVDGWPTPHALTEDEIIAIIDDFERGARRAVVAGFDFVEIHGAHGYLLNSFFSPISNRRSDGWGADESGRMRLPLAVARRLRAAIPASMPLLYRLSVVDGIEGGLGIDDNIRLAAALREVGVDLVDCSSGGIAGASGGSTVRPAPGYLVPFAERIRREAQVPTMAVGLIFDPEQANDVISEGCADLVAMGRQLLMEPTFPHRAALALGHPDANGLLPEAYSFFLRRRPVEPGRG